MNINDLCRESHDRAVRKGFYEKRPSIGEQLCLIHSEISEALEEHRLGQDHLWISHGKPEGLPAELADAVIRICDMAASLDIDLEKVIRLKSDYNETRGHKHGGKRL